MLIAARSEAKTPFDTRALLAAMDSTRPWIQKCIENIDKLAVVWGDYGSLTPVTVPLHIFDSFSIVLLLIHYRVARSTPFHPIRFSIRLLLQYPQWLSIYAHVYSRD